MQEMLYRTNLILTMNSCHIDLKHIRSFRREQLLRCCEMLSQTDIPSYWYQNRENTLSEMIENEGFFDYLAEFVEADLDIVSVDHLVMMIRSHGETVTDYPAERIISTLKTEAFKKTTYYDYLKYYSHLPLNSDRQSLIAENLDMFYKQQKVLFSDLTEAERALFDEPFISCSDLFPIESVKRTCELLVLDTDLLELMRFLYENKIEVSLDAEEYEVIHKSSSQIKEGFFNAFRLFSNDTETMTDFVTRWQENNCLTYDLDVLEKRLQLLDAEQRKDAVKSRSGYINLLYGNKISNIPLADIRDYQEDILIYAITSKKNRFIRLVEENYSIFENMSRFSILFDRDFYTEYINLNTLTKSNLDDCRRMSDHQWELAALRHESYTFTEIKTLYGLSEAYIHLYDRLTTPRVDDRLITLKQLAKRKLLIKDMDDADISKLAEKLSVKPLYTWMRDNFSHISELKAPDAIQLLLSYDELTGLIPQMKTPSDVMLAVRNRDRIQGFPDMESLKDDMLSIDTAWASLLKAMDFSKEFVQENKDHIISFVCRNGAQIALTYYLSLSNGKREAFKRIVKAELMGRFESLKYFEDDLRREISYPVDDTLKTAWANNSDMMRGDVFVKEYDDFFSTMLMGTMPQRTCMSYMDGQYKECLLSGFDTNKKLLYAYVDGKVAGRAIIRLTKGRYSNPEAHIDEGDDASLSFVDLETATELDDKQKSSVQEVLTIFLERPYIAGVSPEIDQQIKSLFIEIMEAKASMMGSTLVLSRDYYEAKKQGYINTMFNLYISQSKAGAQYFDSLSGSAYVSDEKSYRSSRFLIREQDVRK